MPNMYDLPPPETVFGWASFMVLPVWIALLSSLFLPRLRPWIWRLSGLVVPLILALTYGLLLIAASNGGAKLDFSSFESTSALMQNPYAFVAGWVHYLAFDLFVGTQLTKKGFEKGHPIWLLVPVIILSFLFGPLGLALYALNSALISVSKKASS